MSLLTPLLWILILSPIFLIAYKSSKKSNLKYLLFFMVFFLLDAYVNIFGGKIDILRSMGLNYNWIGKIASFLFAIIFVFAVSKKDRYEIGITTSHKKTLKSGVLIFTGFLFVDFIFKMIVFPKGGSFDLETFLFQLTIPGLTEEILYRGIYLWLLNKAFSPSWNFNGVQFGWSALITTFLFGMIHGVFLDQNLEIQIDVATIIYLTLISSLSLLLLRKLSGNIIYPIIGHNLINTMNAIIRIL